MSKLDYMTTTAAGEALSYTRQYIGHLVRTKQLAGMRVGRDILVTRESVNAYKKKYHGHRTPGRKPQSVISAKPINA